MLVLIVNNTNALESANQMQPPAPQRGKTRAAMLPADSADPARPPRLASSPTSVEEARILREIEHRRREMAAVACSSTWAEDCIYREAEYAPDFACGCAHCREKFPRRLEPRPARQSRIGVDCQAEHEDDPDLVEDLCMLRNERPRIGSVFLSDSRWSAGRNLQRRQI